MLVRKTLTPGQDHYLCGVCTYSHILRRAYEVNWCVQIVLVWMSVGACEYALQWKTVLSRVGSHLAPWAAAIGHAWPWTKKLFSSFKKGQVLCKKYKHCSKVSILSGFPEILGVYPRHEKLSVSQRAGQNSCIEFGAPFSASLLSGISPPHSLSSCCGCFKLWPLWVW